MLLPLLELACNQALEHDAESLQKVAALQGKTIALEIRGFNQVFYVHPQLDGIEVATSAATSPSVTLAATPTALLKIARSGMDNADLEPGELEINGDPIVAQRFANIASGLDVDWEGLAAEHMGEVPAALLQRGAATAQTFVHEGRKVIKAQINTALTDEFEVVAGAQEVDHFLEEVDDLRAAVDRLEARLNKVLKT